MTTLLPPDGVKVTRATTRMVPGSMKRAGRSVVRTSTIVSAAVAVRLLTVTVDEPTGETSDAAEVEQLRQALCAIPEPFRQVLVLHELEGRSYREIAARLEIPQATVGTR